MLSKISLTILSIFMGLNFYVYTNSYGIIKMNKKYSEENVIYESTIAKISLSGTLTLPITDDKCPAVILIAGYGANDRDVTGMGHKYFKVLAEYLTEQGIAVLRYDKRGVGQSTGNWAAVTSKELAGDVFAGIAYLKTRTEVDHSSIGLVGLSEGGLIASIVGAESTDVAWVVLMAPFVALGVDNLVYQAGLQLKADSASVEFVENDAAMRTTVYTIAQQESNTQVAAQKIRETIVDYLAHLPEAQKLEAEKLPWAFTESRIDMYVPLLTSISYRFYLTYNPEAVLESLQVPVLALAGGNDLTTSPSKIFPILKQAFEKSGHRDYRIIELPNLNHCFQTCKTGALAEYATIKETMAPVALKIISDWILSRV